MNRLVQLVQLIGVNCVPLWGYGQNWSPATILIVYWFESFLGGLLVAARIARHRRLTNKKGHFIVEKDGKSYTEGSFLHHFLMIGLGFTLAHGFFLAVLIGILVGNGRMRLTESFSDVGRALLVTAFFLILGFVMEFSQIGDRPFAWIRSIRNRSLGRTFVVQLTIIIGMLAVGVTNRPAAFFLVFIGLKLLFDAAALLPWADPQKPPPAWLAEAMQRQEAGASVKPFEVMWIEKWKVESAAAKEAELPRGR